MFVFTEQLENEYWIELRGAKFAELGDETLRVASSKRMAI